MKKKKFSSIVVTFIFLLQIFSSFMPIGSAKADETAFPFVTGANLTDGSGNDISQETNVDKDSDVNVNYDFSIPAGQTAVKETSYTVQLPDQIKLKDIQTDTSVKDSSGTQIGSFAVDTASNKVDITFSNDVIGVLSGKFSVSAQFDSSKIGNENPVSIDLGKNSVNVNFRQDTTAGTSQSSGITPASEVQPADAGVGGTDITDTFPFITGFSGLTDKDGNQLGDDVAKDSEVHVNYKWAIPNTVNVNSGDYYKMQLPAQIHIAAPIDQPINDQDGVKVADMHVDTSGLVTLTFTDYPSTHSNVSGYFYIDCHFEESEIGNTNPVTITFAIPGISDPVTVNVNFEQPQPSITKDGSYDPATDEITWRLTVNKENVSVKSASVEDIINAGQVFVPGSVTVNGSPADTSNYSYDSSSKKFIYNFGDITTQQVIAFKTSIHDDLAVKGQGSYNYNNTADLNYTDNGTPQTIISNTKTVNVPVKLISKDGTYNPLTKQIDWTITVNESGRTIDNAVVTDVIPEGLTLIKDSVKVNGVAVSYTVPGQSFVYNLGSITEKKIITFSTSVDQNVYNSNTSPTYNNTATLTGNGVPSTTSNIKGVGVPTNIIQKTGSGYDAATGIITWTITVNDNKTNVAAGAVVTDNIPAGQTYVEGSAGIDDTSNGSFTTLSDGKVVYTFNNGFSKTYTITFQTQVTDPTHYRANYSDTYSNPVNLTAAGINQDTTGTQQVTSNVISKTGEGYDYSTREITWKIVVNKNAMPITNAMVTDAIPAGQQYVSGSAEIDDNTSGSFNSDDSINSTGILKYTFTGTISKTYNITFKTEITDLSIFNTSGNKTLNNTASITGDEIPTDGNAASTGTQTVKNSVVTKESAYTTGNSYIDWTVKANANWSIPLAGTDITSATITDDLQGGLSLDTDTVELYKATVNANGSLVPGDKVNLTADNVKYNPDTREFDFTFPQDAGTGAFILNFRTNVTKTGNYTNSVEFKGTGVDQSSTTTQNGVWFSQGGGGATGETGSIKVIKVSDDGVTPLQGAVFQLLDQYGNVKETSAPTGTDGAALFDKLKYDTNYSVKEIKAPAGYNLSSEPYPFQIHNTADQKDITYNYKDSIIKGNIQFSKEGEDGNALAGAEFTLYDSNGKIVQTVSSGSDGKVQFTGVEYGSYTIKETKAPEGYNPSSQVLTAAIGDNDNGETVNAQPVENSSGTALYELSDTKIRGDIQFKKTDQSGNPLKGAVFTLYRIGDDGKTLTAVKSADGSDLTAVSGADDAKDAAVTTGNVIFSDIEYGNYEIKETTPPSGYYLSSKVLDASITTDGSTVYARPAGDTTSGVYSLSDTRITGGGGSIQGTVSVKKTDDSGNALSGAVFTLYNSSGNPVQTATTDATGVAQFTKVQPGKYTVKETVAPAGYVLSTQVIPVEINMSKTYDIGTVKDTKNAAAIEVKKTDANGNALSGAEFTLYNSGVKVASAVSGQDGIARFSNVVYGNYTIKETRAPAGYDLNQDTLSVQVDSSKTYQFTVADEKGTPGSNNPGGTPNPNNPGGGTPDSSNPGGGTPNPNNPGGGSPDLSNPQGGTPSSISQSLPKTGSMVDTTVLLVVGIMAILAGIWMMKRSKRSEKNI